VVGGNLLPALARIGLRPQDIDLVALSHLHSDHSGTIGTMSDGEPVFPRAQVVVGAGDWQYFMGRRIAAPGHTPGHSLYSVHGRDDRVLLLGDSMYCPQQLSNIDWEVTFDYGPALARRTRESYQRDLERHGGGAVGCHFPELRAARVLSH
jgi:glyoxylase-like metal-dependent hydrolase (beta-lactamase superfamily II)